MHARARAPGVLSLWGCAGLACALFATPGAAQDAVGLLQRPTAYTDVVDAFDGDDVIDVRLSLGFTSFTETAVVLREQRGAGTDDALPLTRFAGSEHVEKRMWMLAEVGLYHDLMLFVRVPFILENQQWLDPTDAARASGLFEDTGADAEWSSRVRDGIPNIDVGAAWGPLNQFRHPGLPTLVLRLSAEVAMEQARVPCLAGGGCFRGAGRGTVSLLGETRFSYRYRYFEPYCGVAYGREWVTTGKDNFFPVGAVPGAVEQAPPARAGFTTGLAFVPWEAKRWFQRLTLDARLSALYFSRGRDYSYLFDVLGTSTHSALAGDQEPWFAHLDGESAPFTGITTVDAHARLAGELTVRIQAARYVRFELGVFAALATSHLITGAHPCRDSLVTEGERASCAGGRPNPNFRSLIDRPGQRFRVSDVFRLGTTVAATAAF